jgi:hypothetical protein
MKRANTVELQRVTDSDNQSGRRDSNPRPPEPHSIRRDGTEAHGAHLYNSCKIAASCAVPSRDVATNVAITYPAPTAHTTAVSGQDSAIRRRAARPFASPHLRRYEVLNTKGELLGVVHACSPDTVRRQALLTIGLRVAIVREAST